MRKLLLKCSLAPGDIVMLTAAVRDLHFWYPGEFITDVRTSSPSLWENNPHITSVREDDPETEVINCTYPLIDLCNDAPYHCLHGFIEFLNRRLKLQIRPMAFKGDIHLSKVEKSWFSQVHELTGEDTPFWIIGAGGKYDMTIKWWETRRYQEVVEHFRGRIQFVQVGRRGYHHPKLEGVVDLRGQTSLRELVRLVYHSQGVLSPVTSLMHLAAAVPFKKGRGGSRACVVVAGGREPAHWEAYPNHQFIHTNGMLACCAQGGCWRDRTTRLRDGDKRDGAPNRCVNVVNELPRCMDMIQPAEVIKRIEMYYEGRSLEYLTPEQQEAAGKGVRRTSRNSYDGQPLSLHNAGMECERFAKSLRDWPGGHEGRGIVICGGGVKYFTNAWVCINQLRRLGCRLSIEFWHLGRDELDENMRALLGPLGVECVDAFQVKKLFPVRRLAGWELKAYALLHCRFREVLLLDADNVAVVNPEFLFETREFKQAGAIFWPDYPHGGNEKARAIWRSCGVRFPREPDFETGQILVDKARCWRALRLALWFNEHSDFYYQYLYGDKETFHLAFRKSGQSYRLVPFAVQGLRGAMCQHDFSGRRLFQHRNERKWDLLLPERTISGFWFEKECREDLHRLRQLWDGGISAVLNKRVQILPRKHPLEIRAVMHSLVERETTRSQTLKNLAGTDWKELPARVEIENGERRELQTRQARCAARALRGALELNADYFLLLEDGLEFNQHLRHNLESWPPLRAGSVSVAGLSTVRVREIAFDVANRARVVDPREAGGKAFLLSKRAIEHILGRWHRVAGAYERRIPWLAGGLGAPILYHAPSLAQNIGPRAGLEDKVQKAGDFEAGWKA